MTTSIRTTPQSGYAASVQRARSLLVVLLFLLAFMGIITTAANMLASQQTLDLYRAIVSQNTTSADAAQEARAALLEFHSQAATRLVDGADAVAPADESWQRYQEAVRRLWANRQPNDLWGEGATFDALDRASLRYRADFDGMQALIARGDRAAGQEAFLAAHEVLVREVLPALNGIEGLKLDNMEAAYADREGTFSDLGTGSFVVGIVFLILLALAYIATRVWLRYRWTWEIVLASLAAILLYLWFNLSLAYAGSSVKVLVRDTYDSVSAIQSVEALLTQMRAMESLALVAPGRAERFLRDRDEYSFLLQQQLCGEPEPSCLDTPFTRDGRTFDPQVQELARQAQSKYGLPQPPLVANATRQSEVEPLESLRQALVAYRDAGRALQESLTAGNGEPAEYRAASTAAYDAALAASASEQAAVRGAFETLYNRITLGMSLNRLLALLFTALAALAIWGLRRRRQALFT